MILRLELRVFREAGKVPVYVRRQRPTRPRPELASQSPTAPGATT